MKKIAAAAVAVAFATAACAQILVVDPSGGGTHTSLQAAIDIAPAGAVIHVRGGSYPPIHVTRSVAIVASPMATITQPLLGIGVQPPAIRLQGTGTEHISLANLHASNAADGGFGWNRCGPAVHAHGVARLTIEDSILRGAWWTILSGAGAGASALVFEGAGSVVLQRSVLEASPSAADSGHVPDGAPGVEATDAHVTVLHSRVSGGSCDAMVLPWTPWPQPCPCPNLPGVGGAGIRAAGVVTSGSNVVPGQGSHVYVQGQPWGAQRAGTGLECTTAVDLPVVLTQAAPLRVGAVQLLTFLPVGAMRVVVTGSPVLPPVTLAGVANVFVDFAAPVATQFVAIGTNQLALAVPNHPSLLGVAVVHQGLEVRASGFTATNPVLGIVLP